jgi:hypothetical protein
VNTRELLNTKRNEMDALFENRKMRDSSLEWSILAHEILHLERILAKENGESYVEETDIGIEWDGMQSCPIMIADCLRCFVVLKMKSKECALVEYQRIAGYRVLALGDDDFRAHPLSGKGLKPYGIFEVKNSAWSNELESMRDKCDIYSKPSRQVGEVKHYFIYFKARTFEVLAESCRIRGIFPSKEDA